MDIEIFTSGCYLCKRTVDMVRGVIGPKCSLRVYNLSESTEEITELARKYEIRTIPTIVGNGRKMFEGIPDRGELVKCSLEHGCRGRLLED